MKTRTNLAGAVAAIHDAALQPEIWPEALSQMGTFLDSAWVVMGARRFTGQTDLAVQDQAQDAEVLTIFQTRYHSPSTNPSIPSLLAKGQGGIVLREEEMTDAEWHRSGLYRELYRTAGVYHGLGAFVLRTDTHAVFLGVNRTKRRGPFLQQDLDLIRYALPHFRRSMQVFLRLADLESHKRAHEAFWDTLAYGVILVDAEGKALWTNRAATTILTQADGLSLSKGRICASSSRENAELQGLLRAAIATGSGRAATPGGALRVSRPSLARPLALLIAPIRVEPAFVRRPVAVVLITDPERKSEMAPELLKRLYGFTTSEAGLAALLVQGHDLRRAAEQLDVSINTARTHLRLLFEKTDTHRQSELVRLLLRSPAGLLSRKDSA